jgi:hypothetical protein
MPQKSLLTSSKSAGHTWSGPFLLVAIYLLALHPAVIIPGHGPVLHDDLYVKLMVRLLASIRQQVEAAGVRGETLEQARKSVNLDEFQKLFAGDSRMRNLIFRNYVTGPAVEAAFSDASAKKS